MKEEDILIKLAEISEAIKYIDKHISNQDQEIKSLHRENAKQSEEIRDVMYLADILRLKQEQIVGNCADHKACDSNQSKELDEQFTSINQKIDQISDKRLVTVVNTIITAIVTLFGILGALTGWIKFGG